MDRLALVWGMQRAAFDLNNRGKSPRTQSTEHDQRLEWAAVYPFDEMNLELGPPSLAAGGGATDLRNKAMRPPVAIRAHGGRESRHTEKKVMKSKKAAQSSMDANSLSIPDAKEIIEDVLKMNSRFPDPAWRGSALPGASRISGHR